MRWDRFTGVEHEATFDVQADALGSAGERTEGTMFAIDHAATALLIKRRYPSVPMTPILISVQAMEFAWVLLNYLAVERTTTEPEVRSVVDIHLSYMPFSHSVAIPVAVAFVTWLVVEKGMRRPALGRAVGIGIVSHLVLDLLTHNHDVVLWPGSSAGLGLGLYGTAPMTAFFLEFVYGVFCWWVYRGGRGLLVFVVLANLANLSLFSSAVPGPEVFLAGHPMLIVTLIAAQIVITLAVVGVLSRKPAGASSVMPQTALGMASR